MSVNKRDDIVKVIKTIVTVFDTDLSVSKNKKEIVIKRKDGDNKIIKKINYINT